MNNSFIKRFTSFCVSLALLANLSACLGNNTDDLSSEDSDAPDLASEDIATETPEVLPPNVVVDSITSLDKPFRLQESFIDENDNLVYQEFGPEFYEKEINGLKYLINAETKEVCLSGYINLGRLSLLAPLKSENGGNDSDLGYSGYALLAIYNVDGRILFSLYDFDDFTPLLDKCDFKSMSFSLGKYYMYYIEPYDPEYRGNDDVNDFTGQVFDVVKDGVRYLVDANDFTKIVLSGDFSTYNVNISASGNATISYYDYDANEYRVYTSEQLVPYHSDVLQRALTKSDNNK